MDPRPLGIFDSGVGGLTVVRAVQNLLPGESIVYLGDTARVPYGSKSRETLQRFAEEDLRFLLAKDVKAVVVACNSATAYALDHLQKINGIPILGVIEPGIEGVLSDPDTERVGIIATRATIRSHAYQHALAQRRPGLMILEQPAPLLVPIVEEDWIDHAATELILHEYLDPLLKRGMDSLLLACTHYPLLIPRLHQFLGDGVRLVDSASTCARHLEKELSRLDILAPPESQGRLDLFLTDLSEQSEILTTRFLESPVPRIRRATL